MKSLRINIASEVSNFITTRNSIRLVFDKIQSIENNQRFQIQLDFKGVNFISRAAAHELKYNVEILKNEYHTIIFKNLDIELSKMMESVKLASSKSKKPSLARYYITSSKEFNALLAF